MWVLCHILATRLFAQMHEMERQSVIRKREWKNIFVIFIYTHIYVWYMFVYVGRCHTTELYNKIIREVTSHRLCRTDTSIGVQIMGALIHKHNTYINVNIGIWTQNGMRYAVHVHIHIEANVRSYVRTNAHIPQKLTYGKSVEKSQHQIEQRPNDQPTTNATQQHHDKEAPDAALRTNEQQKESKIKTKKNYISIWSFCFFFVISINSIHSTNDKYDKRYEMR